MISYDTWKTASPYDDYQDYTQELNFELTCDKDKVDDMIDILDNLLSNIDIRSTHEIQEDTVVLQIVADYTYEDTERDSSSAWDWFYDACYKNLYSIDGFHNIEQL